MSDYTELIARLRTREFHDDWHFAVNEAADAIEAQQREIARLTTERDDLLADSTRDVEMFKSLTAELDAAIRDAKRVQLMITDAEAERSLAFLSGNARAAAQARELDRLGILRDKTVPLVKGPKIGTR